MFFVPAFAIFRIFAVNLIVATPLISVMTEPKSLPFKLNTTFLPARTLPFASLITTFAPGNSFLSVISCFDILTFVTFGCSGCFGLGSVAGL